MYELYECQSDSLKTANCNYSANVYITVETTRFNTTGRRQFHAERMQPEVVVRLHTVYARLFRQYYHRTTDKPGL